jgi:hypothetical protein
MPEQPKTSFPFHKNENEPQIDPYFASDIADILPSPKPEKVGDEINLFEKNENRLAFISLLLAVIGKTLDDADQETLDKMCTEEPYVPKIFSELADRNCKHCYGRGISGWRSIPGFKEKLPQPCNCVKKARKNLII